MKYLIVIVMFLSGCATMNFGGDAEIDRLNERHERGEIGELEYAHQTFALAKKYFPNSYSAHELARNRIALASALERKEITRLQFDMTWSRIYAQFQAGNQSAQSQPMSPIQAILMMNMINNSANNISHSLDNQRLNLPTNY